MENVECLSLRVDFILHSPFSILHSPRQIPVYRQDCVVTIFIISRSQPRQMTARKGRMHMLKRMALFLILLLALCGASALAAEGTVVLNGEKNTLGYDYLFSGGDALYISSRGYLGVWHPGDEGITDHKIVTPGGDDNHSMNTFWHDGKLYSVVTDYMDDEDGRRTSHTMLCSVSLSGEEAICEELRELDWSELSYDSGDDTLTYDPQQVLALDGRVFIRYEEIGKNGGNVPHIAVLSLEEDELKLLDDLEDIIGMSAYKDGELLLLQHEFGDDEARIITYDPEEEEDGKFAKFEVGAEDVLCGLAYDAANDVALYTHNEMVEAIEKGSDEPDRQLAPVPLRNWGASGSAVVMADGRYALCDMFVALVDISGEMEDQVTVTINDGWQTLAVDNAIQSLHTTAPNITVLKDRNEDKINDLVENLMNQDDSVDIYVVKTSLVIYDALMSRNFMSPLDDDAVIAEHVGKMYPVIREAVTSGGRVMALPVEASVIALGCGEEALKKLGMSLSDLPDTWGGLLDFMAGLKDELEENDLHFTPDYVVAREIRSEIFKLLMKDYRSYMAEHPNVGFNTDLLRGLLEKLDKLDLDALGVPEKEDSTGWEDMEMVGQNSNDRVLFNPALAASFYNDDMNLFHPLLPKLEDGDTPRMNLYLVVAFINPYSRHPEAARRVLEELTRTLPSDTLYTMMPGLNTPIRGKNNEQILREQKELIEQKQRQLEKASGVAHTTLESEIANAEDVLSVMEQSQWQISQRDIDWFRAHDDRLLVEGTDWLETEDDLVQQYIDGDISPEDLLETLDRKIRMMRMEGN